MSTVPRTPPSRKNSKGANNIDVVDNDDDNNNNNNEQHSTRPQRPTHNRTPSKTKIAQHRRTPSQSQTSLTSTPIRQLTGDHYPFTSTSTTDADADTDTAHSHHDTDSPIHFSPSKARAAAIQSQHLSTLTRWLDGVIPPPPSAAPSSSSDPTTSSAVVSRWQSEHRNLQTTRPDLAADAVAWLTAVMDANRLADERRRVVFEARRAELEELEECQRQQQRRRHCDDADGSVTEDLLGEIKAGLAPDARLALESLADTTVRLGRVPALDSWASPDSIGTELARAVAEYTLQVQSVQDHVDSLQDLQQELTRQLEKAQSDLELFEGERQAAMKDAERMHPQTTQWNRETRQISMKIKEYSDRVAALERSRLLMERNTGMESPLIKVEDIIKIQDRLSQRRSVVEKLEEKVKVLNGLPPDLRASRTEVRRAKVELERLKARREELFGLIASR